MALARGYGHENTIAKKQSCTKANVPHLPPNLLSAWQCRAHEIHAAQELLLFPGRALCKQ
eukprot:12408516-Karenia_brevis.AAC.1